jgi:hypothetical protein
MNHGFASMYKSKNNTEISEINFANSPSLQISRSKPTNASVVLANEMPSEVVAMVH